MPRSNGAVKNTYVNNRLLFHWFLRKPTFGLWENIAQCSVRRITVSVKKRNIPTDLKLKSFAVTEPRAEDLIYEAGKTTYINITVTIWNVGDAELPENEVRNNFGLMVYLAKSQNFEDVLPVDTSAILDESQYLQQTSIPNSDDVTLFMNASITIPVESCDQYTVLCVEITIYDSSNTYLDGNTVNNYKCQSMEANRTCLSDLTVAGLFIQNSTNQKYTPGKTTWVNFDLIIKNAGTESIPNSTDTDSTNFNVKLTLTNNQDYESADSWTNIEVNTNYTYAETLQYGIGAGENITITDLTAPINIHPANCEDIHWLCARVFKPTNRYYGDALTNNNDYCIAFGEDGNTAGEKLACDANSVHSLSNIVIYLLLQMVASNIIL
uniref:Uncharacterized protein LOC100366316 n=1 Tax=Saccoglossus kowalevskii TaxID=10224 RepID=A0ABM0GUN1_SACKO|nr:PREDICTED: uncharacterized protein LOC100366316 [Saccoglossus kowalevskii]